MTLQSLIEILVQLQTPNLYFVYNKLESIILHSVKGPIMTLMGGWGYVLKHFSVVWYFLRKGSILAILVLSIVFNYSIIVIHISMLPQNVKNLKL